MAVPVVGDDVVPDRESCRVGDAGLAEHPRVVAAVLGEQLLGLLRQRALLGTRDGPVPGAGRSRKAAPSNAEEMPFADDQLKQVGRNQMVMAPVPSLVKPSAPVWGTTLTRARRTTPAGPRQDGISGISPWRGPRRSSHGPRRNRHQPAESAPDGDIARAVSEWPRIPE
jgi:hypothetical protein